MRLNDRCNAVASLVCPAHRVEVDAVGVRRFAVDRLVESIDGSHLAAFAALTTARCSPRSPNHRAWNRSIGHSTSTVPQSTAPERPAHRLFEDRPSRSVASSTARNDPSR